MRYLTSALAFLGVAYLAFLAGCGTCAEGSAYCSSSSTLMVCEHGALHDYPARSCLDGAGGASADFSTSVIGSACPAIVYWPVCGPADEDLRCEGGVWTAKACPWGCFRVDDPRSPPDCP